MLTSAVMELCFLPPSPGKTLPKLQLPARGVSNAQREHKGACGAQVPELSDALLFLNTRGAIS